MKKLLLATVAAAAFGLPAVGLAQDTYTFALVPKAMNNPFFDQARDGCFVAQEALADVECYYIGPAEHTEADQLQIVQDLISQGVDGIAVASSNAPAMARVLQAAVDAGIPVITWDSDLLPEDAGMRAAYVGTHNYMIGVGLAEQAIALNPEGGTILIQSGGAAAANHNERMAGIRDTLRGEESGEAHPGPRLDGENGWTEIEVSPLYTNDDFPLSVQQLADVLGSTPDLDVWISTGGFPHFAPNAFSEVIAQHRDRLDSGELSMLIADTLPVQLDFVRNGETHGLVGQRPWEMGYRSMFILRQMMDGVMPSDPTYTGLDACTSENIETCVGG
ncbi:MAG: sugar-binding protein [Alphaproteobacteria bacterium]